MKLLFFSIILNFSFATKAHSYFFAFAELRYNSMNQNYELIITGSAHDLEDALNLSGIEIKELEDHYADSTMNVALNDFIQKGVCISIPKDTVKFDLIGYEVDQLGMVHFYFKSRPMAEINNYMIKFDLLMTQFPKQQNKFTHFHDNSYETAVFVANKTINQIAF